MNDEFSHLIGNDAVKDYLSQMVQKAAIGNSILFAGHDGIGKGLFAMALASMIICRDDPHGNHRHKIQAECHPDIRIYRPEGKTGMHSIGSMKQFTDEVYQFPNEAKYRIFIIHEADRMLSYSANALLKTFEEPAATSIIILLTSSPEAMLATILSRCRKIYFAPVPTDQIETWLKHQVKDSEIDPSLAAVQARGSVAKALELMQQGIDPNQLTLQKLLAKGSFSSYQELSNAAEEISTLIENKQKEIESAIRKDFIEPFGDNLSAAQKESLEKEVEGAIAMHYINEVNNILNIILEWYRDVHLLQTNSEKRYLFNPYAEEDLRKTSSLLPLDTVQQVLKDAKKTLDRSTALNIGLENIFLKLNFL